MARRRLICEQPQIQKRELARKRSGISSRQHHAEAHQSITSQQSAVLSESRTHGNAHVARSIAAQRETASPSPAVSRKPIAATPSEIAQGARSVRAQPGVRLALAGTPLKKDPPVGMKFIAGQSTAITLGGKPAGFTGIKGAGAFTAPTFSTRMSAEKDGFKRRYYAEVDKTTTSDVTHSSYYPAPGVHDNAISEQKDGTYTYFWSISLAISELIRKGEQEHLNDAKRAYDLTYGLIAKEINAMAGTKFGPTDTPAAAEQLAEAELAKRLPAALGTNPTKWFTTLESMLAMTLKRDHQHLHDLVPGESVRKGKTFYIPLQQTDQTSIDQVHSDEIVTYPGGAQAGGAATSGPDPEATHENHRGE